MPNKPSEMPPELVEQLKDLSIRGRMAMAIECLTPVFEYYELPEDLRQDLLDILWRFVEEFNTGQWDEDRQKNGILVIVDEFVEIGKEIPPSSPLWRLPVFVLEMIYNVEQLGSDELYGAVVGHSELTLGKLARVLNLALKHGFAIPSITRFLSSPFSDHDKWGRPTPRTSFMKR